jgi:hypothetical protein
VEDNNQRRTLHSSATPAPASAAKVSTPPQRNSAPPNYIPPVNNGSNINPYASFVPNNLVIVPAKSNKSKPK